jgi:MFS transporter, MHS family, shikimate and dehydroshikimate transport protein
MLDTKIVERQDRVIARRVDRQPKVGGNMEKIVMELGKQPSYESSYNPRLAHSRRSTITRFTPCIISFISSTIEWYNFFLYGVAAALIFNHVFFPDLTPLAGALAAFATYGIGFIARPLGALIFGHFGDRIGRNKTFVHTFIVISLPTLLIAFVPPYSTIGYAAPALLVAFRFVQGLAVGGGWGAVIFAVEHAEKKERVLFGSISQAGVPAGLTLASLAMAGVSLLNHADFIILGWRVPFLLSGLLLVGGWFARRRVTETPQFNDIKQRGIRHDFPIMEVFRRHASAMLLVLGARIASNSHFYTITTFALWYGSQRGIPTTWCLRGMMMGAAISTLLMPLCGFLGDKIGARRAFLFGLVLIAASIGPFWASLQTQSEFLVTVAIVFSVVLSFAVSAQEGSLFAEQFPAAVRYSGASFAVNTASSLGGLAPFIATGLVTRADGHTTYVSCYIVALGIISILCVALMETLQRVRK